MMDCLCVCVRACVCVCVYLGGGLLQTIGKVTSGAVSPILKTNISMCAPDYNLL